MVRTKIFFGNRLAGGNTRLATEGAFLRDAFSLVRDLNRAEGLLLGDSVVTEVEAGGAQQQLYYHHHSIHPVIG